MDVLWNFWFREKLCYLYEFLFHTLHSVYGIVESKFLLERVSEDGSLGKYSVGWLIEAATDVFYKKKCS